MRGLRAVLFDYGGTLDGPASHWLDRFVDLYRRFGVERPFEELKAAFYAADQTVSETLRIREASLRELMDFHVAVQFSHLGLGDERLRQELVDLFVRDSQAALAAGRRVLERLAPRYRLGVVSNFYGNVERILADAGLLPFLSVVADSARVGAAKPDPAIFRYALERLQPSPAETLHVGDSYERDVEAARRAGLRTAWLVGEKSRGPVDDPSAADLVVHSLEELAQRLEEAGESERVRSRSPQAQGG